MGIKFRCPNGHKLNVKAFLAGKRGICPKCGDRFEIPARSGGQVVSKGPKRRKVELTGDGGEGTRGQEGGLETWDAPIVLEVQEATELREATGARGPESQAAADLSGADPGSVWYVRPASGGQFGPAAGNVMRKWIEEGRVAADSMVWQNGWETWRKADELFPEINPHSRDRTGARDRKRAGRKADQPETVPAAIDVGEKPLVRRKQKPMMTLSVVLIGVVVVLAVILVAVLWLR